MNTSGIDGPLMPEEMPKLEEPSPLSSGSSGSGDIKGLMNAKVSTLGDLKSTLIQYLGEQEGTKFYNQFMMTFAMTMLQQVQQSAQQAKKAAQNMRMDT